MEVKSDENKRYTNRGQNEMSFDFRFTPPTLTYFEDRIEYDDCDHKCETCFWDCGEDQK